MELLLAIPFLAFIAWRELSHDRRVNELLDRIQAPETVIAQRAPEPSSEPLYVPVDDDEAQEAFQRANGEVL